eukprot:COSAG06_NODE_3529_length_5226_cov_6.215526_1_plen_95_part_10
MMGGMGMMGMGMMGMMGGGGTPNHSRTRSRTHAHTHRQAEKEREKERDRERPLTPSVACVRAQGWRRKRSLTRYLLRRILVYKPKDSNRDWSPRF